MASRCRFLTTILLIAFISAPALALASGYAWDVKRNQWTRQDEENYAQFIAKIGEAVEKRQCFSVDGCLNGSVPHPYRASNPADMKLYADCADLPYLLRAYFAWKNGLPFAYVTRVGIREGARWRTGVKRDIRYSPGGNYARSRSSVGHRWLRDSSPGVGRSYAGPREFRADHVFRHIRATISTAQYRVLHQASDPTVPDFYPVRIGPQSIRPGTVIYDSKGHVAVVYKISDDGRVYFIDSHPDNSLTRGSYGAKFSQKSRPTSGPGFKNWRPLRLVGGRVEPIADREIADHSLEQFFGVDNDDGAAPTIDNWKDRVFRVDGRSVGFHEFVRARLAGTGLRFEPLGEVRQSVDDLCVDLEYRALAVREAVQSGITAKAQPSRLPHNIYGTHGEWETYSTPSRDARLKTSFKELYDMVAKFLRMHRDADPLLDYQGDNLAGALREVYASEAQRCRINYQASNGEARTLDMLDIVPRLFRLSFDPYHCVERRWGASSASELSSCADGPSKADWYAAQATLRNQIERRYDVRMDYSLAELRRRADEIGRVEPPSVDVLQLLDLERVAGAD